VERVEEEEKSGEEREGGMSRVSPVEKEGGEEESIHPLP